MTIKYIGISIFVVLIILFIIDTLRVYRLVQKGNVLADTAVPFERVLLNASSTILVLGDSTAFGTGVHDSRVTTAGRLGAFYPEASLTNKAKNGLRLEGLSDILSTIPETEHYSLILVQIGGNDIIRFTSKKDVESRAGEAFKRLSRLGDAVIVLHAGDVGNARVFPVYLRPIYTRKSYQMREIYKRLISPYTNIKYVDLLAAPSDNLFRDDPKTYYAEDMLHLSEFGNEVWFNEIKKLLAASL